MAVAEEGFVNVSLYQAAAALNANARYQEILSENLAAGNLPGFKRQDMTFSEVAASSATKSPSQLQYTLPRAEAKVSFSQGELKYTGLPTDVAIDGPGFFEVQLPTGAHAFTRDGEFQLNAQGQLVTKQGYPVIAEGGTLQMDRNNSLPITIGPDGSVSQGSDRKGAIRVVEFDQPRDLTPMSGGLFVAEKPGMFANKAVNSTVQQGFTENANSTPMVEMANLIGVMRAFEANQKVIQTQDERMSRAISELGNPN